MAKTTPKTKGDPGEFLSADDPRALGVEGWYHFNTPKNQTFVGHDGQPDYYIYDFNFVQDDPNSVNYVNVGKDKVDKFELGGGSSARDEIVVLDFFGQTAEFGDPSAPARLTSVHSKSENFEWIQKKSMFSGHGFSAKFYGQEAQIDFDPSGNATVVQDDITTGLGSFRAKSTVGGWDIIA